jgi:hypothetical protein
VAAIAGLLLAQAKKPEPAGPASNGPQSSPWKLAWRAGGGRWNGIIGGAGGVR